MLCYRKSKRLVNIFTGILSFYQSQKSTETFFLRYLQHNNNFIVNGVTEKSHLQKKIRLNHYISYAGTYWVHLYELL